jgi:predicted nucleic-acid-binding protein
MVAAGIDTNVFLRVFIDDDGPQYKQAVERVKAHGQVFIGTVVMVEAIWALRSLFRFPKEKLVQFLNTVLDADAFVLENREVVEAAMFGYASGKAGFPDYVILESARQRGVDQVFTFDRDLGRAEGCVLIKARGR